MDAAVGQRIIWALMEGAVAIALLVGGGLKAMQAANVSSGILFLFCSLFKLPIHLSGLSDEYTVSMSRRKNRSKTPVGG